MKNSKILWIIIILLILINLIGYLVPWGNEKSLMYFSDILPVIASGISLLCLFIAIIGFRSFDFTQKAWLMILLGMFLFYLAESIYGVLEVGLKIDMNETFPTFADYFWCAGYIPLFIGLGMMFFGYKKSGLPMGNPKLYIGLSFLFLILSFTVIYFLLIPIIKVPETNLISKIIYLFYPVADLFLVIPSAILMYITSLFGGGTISRPWKYLAFGFILFTIADLLYSYLGWQDLYGNGNLIDLAWHAGYLFIGLAGLYQRELVDSLKKD